MKERNLKKVIAEWRRAKPRIIVLAGPRKAGKDKLRLYIKKNYRGFRDLRIVDAIVKIARVLEIEPERRVFHALFGVNHLLRPILGQSAYVRRVGRILDRERPELALVQAARTEEEYREFVLKRKGILIGIKADPKIRYLRAVADVKRLNEKKDEGRMSFKDFLGDPKKETGEYSPIEREISRIVSRAHYIVENNYETPALFYREIDKIMKILGVPKK